MSVKGVTIKILNILRKRLKLIFCCQYMTTFDNVFLGNSSKQFICENCDYTTSRKYNLDLHYNSMKHKINISTTENLVKLATDCKTYDCLNCDKSFKDRSGLWRHKKKCTNNDVNVGESKHQSLVEYLLKENAEFKQLMIDQNKQMLELAKNSGHHNNNTTNNNNNQQFNLNFYLNVSVKDLENTGRLGFSEGISKIFIDGLKQINVNDRPLHCSDLKRETLYIKDNNEWNKESEQKTILTNAIKHVSHKNMKQITEWTKLNPEYKDSSSKVNDKYLKIVSEAMSGVTEEETNKNYSKIIKNIIKETVIDKVSH
jgi:hypothetical protein